MKTFAVRDAIAACTRAQRGSGINRVGWGGRGEGYQDETDQDLAPCAAGLPPGQTWLPPGQSSLPATKYKETARDQKLLCVGAFGGNYRRQGAKRKKKPSCPF